MFARMRPRFTYANVMATVAVFLALGGGALAATSFIGSDGKITGCVTKKGQLRVLKPGKRCSKGTTKIAWNQKGPVGPQGLKGDQGPPATNAAHAKTADTATNAGNADKLDNKDSTAFALRSSEGWYDLPPSASPSCGPSEPGVFCGYAARAWYNRPNGSGQDYNKVGYYRDPTGIVRLKGLARCRNIFVNDKCEAGVGGIFYLPPGYRPAHEAFYPTLKTGATNDYVRIRADGAVEADDQQNASDYISLEGISFRCGPSGQTGCP